MVVELKQNVRYQATVKLSGIELFAPNELVAKTLEGYGFSSVHVQGGGDRRQVVATWSKETRLISGDFSNRIEGLKELENTVAA